MSAVSDCKYISDDVKKSPFIGQYHNQLLNADTIGIAPKMPTPSEKPINVVFNHAEILQIISNKTLSYLQIEKRSMYGVYYALIAKFDDDTWLCRDQSGLFCLRQYSINSEGK